ncbi:hypothetical protein PHK61_31595 [Actinomycetospora lutea]|uniref:hypothetical protein n=1 Tax=Actinomycetospora lutea TaxID=663604 RepID=UPI0023656484|nr:hypothetical protein [Actinomycetospora lutea]MDD7942960.1 hypothetical protein [Actinomycetospora lutea]
MTLPREPRHGLDSLDAPTVQLVPSRQAAPVAAPARPTMAPQGPAPALPGGSSSNGWAVAALVLGIVCLALSPVPVLNQAGILVGFVGVGIGVAAVLIGRRRGSRVVVSAVGLGLSVLGLVLSFVFTAAYVAAIDEAFAGLSGGTGDVSEPFVAGPRTYTLEVTSTDQDSAGRVGFTNSTGGYDSAEDRTLPWRQTVTIQDGGAMVTGSGPIGGGGGDLTCTIREGDRVVDTQTVRGQYTNVSCDTY